MNEVVSELENSRPSEECAETDDLGSLIRWTLSLTPLERLDFAQRQANALIELRAARSRTSESAED